MLELRKPPEGKIAVPGAYDLTNAEYHGDVCDGPSISGSGIVKIIEDGPAVYWWDSPMNPNAAPREPAPHFDFGTAAHTLLLEPEKVHKNICIMPSTVLSADGGIRSKEAKDMAESARAKGLTVLKPDDWQKITDMRDALARHPFVPQFLTQGMAEVSVIFRDPVTNVWIKTRPDWLPSASGAYLCDLKTTADLKSFERGAFLDWRYDLKASLMMWGAREVLGLDPKGVLHIVQEKKAPYRVAALALTVTNDDTRSILMRARMQARRGIDLFAHCLETGVWPTGYEQPREMEAPGWHRAEIDRELTAAEVHYDDTYTV